MLEPTVLLPDPLSDCHVRTRLCGHASGEMEDYVVAAIAKGLGRLTFLEHLEEGINSPVTTWLDETSFDLYFAEGERLRRVYGEHISIGLGVECGFNPDAVESLRRRLAARPWDCIGISCHYLRIKWPHHLNLFSRRKDQLEKAAQIGGELLLSRYFASLCEAVVELSAATVLCHLDGALRHLKGLSLTDEHRAQVATLLDLVRDKGLHLELNTSGYTIRGEPFPRQPLLAMTLARNIPLQLGSDAHQPEQVGRFFTEACRLTRSTPC